MVIKALVVGYSDETWFKGTKDERTVKNLNLMDTDSFCQMKESFDYVLPKEDEDRLDVEKLKLSVITLGVSVVTKENGRLKVSRGKIDLGTVPASAFRSLGTVDNETSAARLSREVLAREVTPRGTTPLNGTSVGAKGATVAA